MGLGLSVERVAGDTRRKVASIHGDVGFGVFRDHGLRVMLNGIV